MAEKPLIERYYHLCETIRKHQKSCALAYDDPMLLAVVKRQPDDKIVVLLEAGHRHFAENTVQEAIRRWPHWRAQYDGIELHHIGALQTNKARDAVALYDVIQTIDRPKLIDAVHKHAMAAGKVQRCYIQVNIGEEAQKAGVCPNDLPALIAYCRALSHVSLEGFMCIPPASKPAAPYFALLRELAHMHDVHALSMGMSGDYHDALRFGATHIRIGTALMGERLY